MWISLIIFALISAKEPVLSGHPQMVGSQPFETQEACLSATADQVTKFKTGLEERFGPNTLLLIGSCYQGITLGPDGEILFDGQAGGTSPEQKSFR